MTDANACRVAQARVGKVVGADLDQRKIGVRVVADELARNDAAVGQGCTQRDGPGGHVAVGDEITVGRDDKAGARAALRPPAARRALHADVYDRRPYPCDRPAHRARIRVEEPIIKFVFR